AGAPEPSLRGRGRGRKRPRDPEQRVQWDEANIAEHDKERGTRQKIVEPPTPWARSPASVSDDEGEAEGAAAGAAAAGGAAAGAADPAQLAARLLLLAAEGGAGAEGGGPCDGRGAGGKGPAAAGGAAAPASPPVAESPARGREAASPAGRKTPAVAFAGGSEPKVSSASFKAKRSAHYNEFQMLQAFRRGQGGAGASDESDGQD
ncbi:unnamed protein product, partial [Prorocentrum cordatum]